MLLASSSVAYATGADSPGEDSGRAGLFRSVAVVVRGSDAPHLFTPYWDGAPPELPPIIFTVRSSPTWKMGSTSWRRP